MSSSITSPVTKTPIGADAFGNISVPDVNSLFVNLIGVISNTGQTPVTVQIIAITGINSIICKLAGAPSNTGADLHIYNGGSLFFDTQEISPGFVGRIGPTGNTGPTGPTGGTGGTPNMSAVAMTGGTIGGAVVGLPTVVGTGQLTGGVYAVTATDSRLQVTATASVAAEIDMRAGAAGARLSVVNSGGDPATAQQVTVVPHGADTILGQTDYVLSGRESAIFEYNTVTTDWEVL